LQDKAQRVVETLTSIEWEISPVLRHCRLCLHFETAQDRVRFVRFLSACFKSRTTHENIRSWMLAFSSSDLLDADRFLAELQRRSPFTEWLNTKLPPELLIRTERAEMQTPVNQEAHRALSRALADLVHGHSLYSPEVFAEIMLSGEAVQMLSKERVGEELAVLNWKLLSDALEGIVAPPPKEADLGLRLFHDLATGIAELAEMVGRTRLPKLMLEPADLELCQHFAAAVSKSPFSHIDVLMESDEGLEYAPASLVEQCQKLWRSCEEFAVAIESATRPATEHRISIRFSETDALMILDHGQELHLGNSATRCLLALAVLKSNRIKCGDFFALYMQREVARPDNYEPENRFDAAGKALAKKLKHFRWKSSGSGLRSIGGISWGEVPAEKTLREHLVNAG
jgi:hypothetical protein